MSGNNDLPKPPPLKPKPPIRTTPPAPFQNQTPPPLICARPNVEDPSESIVEHEVTCKNRYCACKLTTNLTKVKSRAEARNLRKARGESDPSAKDGGKKKKKKRKTRSDKGKTRGPQWKGGDPRGGGPRGGGGGIGGGIGIAT